MATRTDQPRPLSGTIYGYARVSTVDQNPSLQIEALRGAGCTRIIEERASGASRNRVSLNRMLSGLREGDVVIVWKLDRIARSLAQLLEIITHIRSVRAHFRCITSPVDTSSPAGTLMLHLLGSVAEFERALTIERTLAGLAVARSMGKIGGNPRIRERNPDALMKLSKIRRERFRADVVSRIEEWRTIVRDHRPTKTWSEITRIVNSRLPGERHFSIPTLVRHVRTAVDESLVDRSVLRHSRRKGPSLTVNDPALKVVIVAFRRQKKPTLAAIAADLEAARVLTRRGSKKWPLSSVANLVKRTELLRLIDRENKMSDRRVPGK